MRCTRRGPAWHTWSPSDVSRPAGTVCGVTAGLAHCAQLERAYLDAPCNETLQLSINISERCADISLVAQPAHHHAAGAVHGSYYFKLLDDAAYFAANSVVEDVFVLTASFSIQLLRPVVGGTLRAHGEVVRVGRNMIFADAVLTDDGGRELARGSGLCAPSEMKLASVPAYAGGEP